jgi:hypothetical protein
VIWPLIAVAIERRWRLVVVVVALSHAGGIGAALLLGTPFEKPDEQWHYLAEAARHIGPVVAVTFILYAAALGAMIYFAVRRSRSSAETTTG